MQINAILWTIFKIYRFQIKSDCASEIEEPKTGIYEEDGHEEVLLIDRGEHTEYNDIYFSGYNYLLE